MKMVLDLLPCILFIFLFFLITKAKVVSKKYIDIFYSDDYESYHWGEEFFYITLSFLKKGFGTSQKLLTYNLRGFSLAVWFYECCPYSEMKLCGFSGSKFLQMLRWYSFFFFFLYR